VASAGPYVNNPHLAPDRYPRQHPTTQCRPDALPDAQPTREECLICSVFVPGTTVMCSNLGNFVCLFVCPQAHIGNCTFDRYQLSARVTYGCRSVLPRQRCDTLCSSGFIDDVMLAHIMARNKRRNRDSIGTMDLTARRIIKLIQQGAAPDRGRSLISRLRLPSWVLDESLQM